MFCRRNKKQLKEISDLNRVKLILPSIEYKDEIMNYRKEFIENQDSLDGTSYLINHTNFEEWLSSINNNLPNEIVRKGTVPATTFIVVSQEGSLIGMISIRHQLNDYLFHFGGHVGYSVRKSERQKGFATEMLALALNECKKLKINRVLITCDKDNLASAKTILNNGGILENELLEEKKIKQRYWIDLDNS